MAEPTTPLLTVVVPLYNERATVGELLRRVLAVPISKEIIVIDDCSTDGSFNVVEAMSAVEPAIRLIRQEKNQGKGAALRRGFSEARGEIVIIQDADLEYKPSEYPLLIKPILDGDAEVVFGSRFEGHPRRVMFFWHTIGNKFLTLLSNLTTNLNLTDMETCYKAFRREVIQSLDLKSDRFGFEPEVTAKVARRGYRIYEVPISYHGREYWEGKKINWKDGVSAIWTILKYGLFVKGDSEPSGYVTLERMGRLSRYSKWIWESIAPYVGNRILEVGAGTGNMTRLLYGHELVVASEIDPTYLAILRNRFVNNPTVVVEPLDLNTKDYERLRTHRFDTVVCLNVLEHVDRDRDALSHLYDLLMPGGRLIIFVPADQKLFGSMDETVGHFRRYSKEQLDTAMRDAGFVMERIRYQNVLGRLGWWLNGQVLRREHMPGGQSRLFDLMVPLLRRLEPEDPGTGLSLLAIARKPLEASAERQEAVAVAAQTQRERATRVPAI